MSTPRTILIAEDDPYLREAYLRRFARTSFSVRTAHDGEEAVAMIQEQTPDLLICDIMMPGKDGWWVLSQLPKKKRLFPVIMLTNLEDDETQEQCKRNAVDGYLVKKDMSLKTLVETAEHLLKEDSH
jgi:CheY-like chemotaxis protein